MAGVIAERAWQRQGVRLFQWPCGTVAVTWVGSRADATLLASCIDQLLVTFARHDLFGRADSGPTQVDVMRELSHARRVSP